MQAKQGARVCLVSGTRVTGVTVFLEGRNSRRLIPLRTEISGCLLGGVFSEPGDF